MPKLSPHGKWVYVLVLFLFPGIGSSANHLPVSVHEDTVKVDCDSTFVGAEYTVRATDLTVLLCPDSHVSA